MVLDTTKRFWIWDIGMFDDMEDDHYSIMHDCFLGHMRGISLPHSMFRLCTYMKEKCQRSLSFDDGYIFELLHQHLKYEAF